MNPSTRHSPRLPFAVKWVFCFECQFWVTEDKLGDRIASILAKNGLEDAESLLSPLGYRLPTIGYRLSPLAAVIDACCQGVVSGSRETTAIDCPLCPLVSCPHFNVEGQEGYQLIFWNAEKFVFGICSVCLGLPSMSSGPK